MLAGAMAAALFAGLASLTGASAATSLLASTTNLSRPKRVIALNRNNITTNTLWD
jgi:hypothetical protein